MQIITVTQVINTRPIKKFVDTEFQNRFNISITILFVHKNTIELLLNILRKLAIIAKNLLDVFLVYVSSFLDMLRISNILQIAFIQNSIMLEYSFNLRLTYPLTKINPQITILKQNIIYQTKYIFSFY